MSLGGNLRYFKFRKLFKTTDVTCFATFSTTHLISAGAVFFLTMGNPLVGLNVTWRKQSQTRSGFATSWRLVWLLSDKTRNIFDFFWMIRTHCMKTWLFHRKKPQEKIG